MVTLKLPPLRERRDDIPLLAAHFIKEFNQRHGKQVTGIAEPLRKAMAAYDWPGNIRELRNLIERIVIMNPQQKIERKHLPALVFRGTARSKGSFTSLQEARATYERDFILKKLEENQGNVSRTAEVLGLERSHLYRKMKSLGIAARE